MKIKFDDEEILELDETTLKLFGKELIECPFEDIKRRLKWVITHKLDQNYKKLEDEWLPKLRQDDSVASIPKSRKEFCELVFARDDYKCRADIEGIEIEGINKPIAAPEEKTSKKKE
ncbi:MAG TPA: hypothetical protein VKZ95_01370 [Sphingobacteriaceae bacterium]|nr:hypothetical protein [Sphingobacteriaceae bacterium]